MITQSIHSIKDEHLSSFIVSHKVYTSQRDSLSAQLPTWMNKHQFHEWNPWDSDNLDLNLFIALVKDKKSGLMSYLPWDSASLQWLREHRCELFNIEALITGESSTITTLDL